MLFIFHASIMMMYYRSMAQHITSKCVADAVPFAGYILIFDVTMFCCDIPFIPQIKKNEGNV